jgi:hypothetical protein
MAFVQAGDYRVKVMPRPVPVERRSRVRFPLELRVRYRTLGRGEPITGEGWVVNVSSGGVLVAYRDEIRAGTPMELNIEWPSRLDGRVPLQLVMSGRVVRCELSGLAVALSRYSFRTTRTTVTPIDATSVGAPTPMVHRVASA